MAIRFKYDATGVVIPQNASNRKYGQTLVLQQKRLEDEQKLLAQQQQMYNQPRRGMQQQAANRQQLGQQQGMANLNAGFGANVAPVNPTVFQDMAGPRRLNTRINNAQANANAVPMDPAAFQGMAAPDQMQEGMLAAQLQARERAGFEEARKAGEYDPVTAAEIQKTYADATKTDMSKDLDAAQKAEWHAENNAKRSELLKNRNPNPSPEELANRNLQYYVPSMKSYVPREQVDSLGPDVEVQVYEGGKPKPGVTPKAPVKEIPQLPQMYEEYKDTNYERHQKALDAKVEEFKSKALEPEGKQYADMGDQELEDAAYAELKGKYERDRVRSAAGKPAEPTQPESPVTPLAMPPALPTGMQNLEPSYNADGTTGEQVEQAIESKLYPQSVPADAAQAVTPPSVAQPPVVPPAAQPPQASAQPQSSQPQAVPPPMDVIGEVNQTFESGTPEQKAMLRQKMKSPDSMSSLETQAKAGNADAYKAISALTAEVLPVESVAGAIIAAKKDGKGAVAELRSRKAAGMLDDASYTEAIVANSGKTAKQNYEMFSGNAPGKYGTGSNTGTQVVRQSAAINALWSEMGMYDSRSYVRAFQKEPTVEDVITHVAMKDNMPRKDAEEYVYNQLLSRSYAKEVQQDFEGKLTKERPKDREKKQDAKRDTWTSKTK